MTTKKKQREVMGGGGGGAREGKAQIQIGETLMSVAEYNGVPRGDLWGFPKDKKRSRGKRQNK